MAKPHRAAIILTRDNCLQMGPPSDIMGREIGRTEMFRMKMSTKVEYSRGISIRTKEGIQECEVFRIINVYILDGSKYQCKLSLI